VKKYEFKLGVFVLYMKKITISLAIPTVLYIGFFIIGMFGMTMNAEAYTNVPAQSCTTAVQNFNPYVYEDGDLHSFDYVVVGETNPTVTTTVVDGRSLENFYSTVWNTQQSDAKKIHVDVPNWYGFSEEVRIMVQVSGETPDCWAKEEFVVKLPPRSNTTPSAITPPVATPTQPIESTDPVPDENQESAKEGSVASEDSNTNDESIVDEVAGAGFLSSLVSSFTGKTSGGQCYSWPSSVWIFLIIICVVAVFVIVDSLPYLLSGNGMRFAVVLLAMFLALLVLWFMFDTCREHRWFPIGISLLTMGTLIMPTSLDKKKSRQSKLKF
jgi:hypothetical protein